LYIIGIYRSPKGNVNEFSYNLENFLKMFSKGKKDIIICGDLNIEFLGNNFKRATDKRKLKF